MDTAISAASCHLRLALSCARLGRVYTLILQRLRGTKRTGPRSPEEGRVPGSISQYLPHRIPKLSFRAFQSVIPTNSLISLRLPQSNYHFIPGDSTPLARHLLAKSL